MAVERGLTFSKAREREGVPLDSKGQREEGSHVTPWRRGALALNFSPLGEGLSPSAHGLGPWFGHLLVYMHACLHALDYSSIPWVRLFTYSWPLCHAHHIAS